MRYLHPLTAQIDLWQIKALMATVLTVLAHLLRVDHTLVGGVLLLLLIDLISGVIAAWRRGEYITSTALRRTVAKIVDYCLMLITLTVLRNLHPYLDPVGAYGCIYLATTEVLSIFENVMGSKTKAREFFTRMFKKAPPQPQEEDNGSR